MDKPGCERRRLSGRRAGGIESREAPVRERDNRERLVPLPNSGRRNPEVRNHLNCGEVASMAGRATVFVRASVVVDVLGDGRQGLNCGEANQQKHCENVP